jgi:hypothetical protein
LTLESAILAAMNTKSIRAKRKSAFIKSSRWIGYATAGAATAVGAAATAEADIHYSGPINQHFDAASSSQIVAYFNLAPGASFGLAQTSFFSGIGAARAGVFASGGTAAFAGFSASGFPYVSKLASGVNINGANFNAAYPVGTLAFAYGYANSQWLAPGTGFIGLRFNTGSGTEYGWARVTMDGSPGNTFTLVDYAYGDVGQSINAGQTAVPEPGSLALLALGGAGLVAWRKRRKAMAA